MEKYKNQLKNFKFNYKIRTKRGQKIKKNLDIITFDIEVTSAWELPNGILTAYEAGHSAEYWNELNKYALPYIWQCSINDQVFYGHELQSFKILLDDLPKDQQFIIFVHNLAYEFEFLLNILEPLKVFARSPHKPIKCTFKEYPNIEWHCTYMLTNLSLENWGNQLGLPKLVGELEYNYMRTPFIYDPDTEHITGTPLFDYELSYCERDCIVVYHGILDHLNTYRDIWDLPLTSTGKVRRKCKKILVNDYEYMREIKRTIPKDAAEYALLRRIFAGGMTHANRKYLGDVITGPVHHLDKASFYPFELAARKYPLNRWCYVGNRLPDPATFNDRGYIMELKFKNIRAISWNTYIPTAKTHGSGYVYDNGRVLAADKLYYTCTEQDYITICNNYEWDEIECLRCWANHKRYLPLPFINIVLDFYEGKTELKGLDPVQYALYKTYINSLFGMCVTALFQSDVVFNRDDPVQWSVEHLTEDFVNEGLDRLRVWYNKKYFLSYTVGCYCTAYARRDLAACIESADSDIIYYDTDSLFYLGDHSFKWADDLAQAQLKTMCAYYGIDFERTRPKDKSGVKHPMGVLEAEADVDRFKTLGAKKYIEERGGKLYMTVAGINKGAAACLSSIDDFTDGFIFDKDHPAVKKLEHTYLSDMQPIVWPGGYHSDFKYGINMRPTGYKISEPNVYRDAIQLMETGKIYFSEYFLSKQRGVFNAKNK